MIFFIFYSKIVTVLTYIISNKPLYHSQYVQYF